MEVFLTSWIGKRSWFSYLVEAKFQRHIRGAENESKRAGIIKGKKNKWRAVKWRTTKQKCRQKEVLDVNNQDNIVQGLGPNLIFSTPQLNSSLRLHSVVMCESSFFSLSPASVLSLTLYIRHYKSGASAGWGDLLGSIAAQIAHSELFSTIMQNKLNCRQLQ